ncbi:la-related protein 6 [Daphnia magna]|uniref:La-related protein 6 n=2 Tax=Daphnia magna TaxID=35525 RepID=A0ABR0AFD6_9CRUS|nr:la-related protein 6 [Daphnia magna]KAK4023826.1 hypothetical protein OUZ56_009224 [Daphnia magna]
MAPNPNECVVVLQMQQSSPTAQELSGQIIKIVTSDVDSTSDEGEHFYDASSDIGGTGGNGGNDVSDDSAPENNSGNKADSGIEDVTFEIPDAELAAQIVEQVEFYFSDAHILKDAFLLKHARRNRDGFISLKLITSFKKVKHVTKDWRVVAHACRTLSKELEVNEAGTKVRRVAPLPETDETSPSRTVVAIGLAVDKASIEGVAEMFNGVVQQGAIGLIRILRPGNTIPPDVRQCANRHPDILTSICAVVEFEQAECARAALKDAPALMPAGVKLVELASRRNGSNKTSPASSRPVTPNSMPSSENNTPNNRRKRRGAQQKNVVVVQDSDAETPRSPFLRRHQNDSTSSTPIHSPQQRRHHMPAHLTGNSRGNTRQNSPDLHHQVTRPKSCSYSEPMTSTPAGTATPPGSHSPWVRRRLGLVAGGGQESGRSSPLADNRLSVPANIVRMPNGPDGTRGFHVQGQHGKPRSASAPEVSLMVTVF